jgi:hypothetical protein
MTLRMEWRTTGEGSDAILFLDDDRSEVARALEADQAVLRVFLNDLVGLETSGKEQTVDDANRDPEAWGHLIMARANTHEIIEVDPEAFWDGILFWFRRHGTDAWIRPKNDGST